MFKALVDCPVLVVIPVCCDLVKEAEHECETNCVDAFTSKLAGQGKFPTDVSTQSLTEPPPALAHTPADQIVQTPPRLVSDQLINIYFQEWAPLYPVVHRPTVLKAYEQYLTNAESLQSSPHDLAQLNLIFGIASLASVVRFSSLS